MIFGANANHVQPRGAIPSALRGVSSADAMKLRAAKQMAEITKKIAAQNTSSSRKHSHPPPTSTNSRRTKKPRVTIADSPSHEEGESPTLNLNRDVFQTADSDSSSAMDNDSDDNEAGDKLRGAHGQFVPDQNKIRLETYNEIDQENVYAMVARHREVFMERAFREGSGAGNVICRPQAELDNIIFVLENWHVKENLNAMEDGELKDALVKFRETHSNGYKWSRTYCLEHIELPDGSPRTIIRRIEKKAVGRIVVSREQVFDAIDEWHRHNGHLGQERTHTFCRQKYYNTTQKLVRLYCETCFVCMSRNPVIAPQKGSRKPIRSNEFRERFQIDLIDMRKLRKKNPYGVLMRWIITVKDHATGLVYIVCIPRKRASFVAHELEKLFGFIGYPSIFHTDNGKEFTAKLILQLLRNNNPNILSVTGRPRVPRDQGSVENMNRIVKRVLGRVMAERRLQNQSSNWTELLGSVMSAINSQAGRGKNAAPSYNAVFGQNIDQNFSCSKEEARRCWTVSERLMVSSFIMSC